VTRRLLIGLGCVTVLALTGCAAVGTEAHETPELEQQRVLAVSPAPAPAPDPTVPRHLTMAEIKAPVVRVHLTGSELLPPSDPTVLGWWGRKAGAAHGVTLLTGHTVHDGGGDLDDLEDVAVGTVATVSGVRYRVTSNEVISKTALAHRASRLFDQTGKHRLVIVTCEGYDPATGHYDSNVVLTAIPLD
jgi:hypothetical protein